MRRLELQEIHDHPRFPGFLRDLVTDALQSLWQFGNSYRPILHRLLAAMDRTGTRDVLDLCSGGGGPWLRLVGEPEFEQPPMISIRLTDKYPNRSAFTRASTTSARLEHEFLPIDATRIPERLGGFRTIFSSFHHFGPEAARSILSQAMEQRRGVGIFEMARRSPRTLLANCWVPALCWLLTPTIRPFLWSRLFWTYLIPVVPFALFYDGLASCLRAYSRQELAELVGPLTDHDYEWQIGEERSGLLPVTYLLGYPTRRPTE